MPQSPVIVPRHAASQLEEALRYARVVVLNGPRQSGKTTLARRFHEERGGTLATFDDAATLAACRADPATFIGAQPKPLIIDEYQRAGDELLYAIKLDVDMDPQPGRFLLTGSTRFLTVPVISESLAGRVTIVNLWPYAQGEAAQAGPAGDSLLTRLLGQGSDPNRLRWPDVMPSRLEYLQRLCRGGFPEAFALTDERARQRWFRDYVATVTQRDVPEISRGRQLTELPRLLQLLAAGTGQELNPTRLAERIDIEPQPLRRTYLPLLETVFLTVSLPAWSRSLAARVSKRPKVYITDTGVAAHLLGVDADALASPLAPATGPLVKTFVVNELVRQVAREDGPGARLCHYRTHDGPEVDVVAETRDGRIVSVEVKSAATVNQDDFRHLASLRDKLDRMGEAFVAGVVLYTGARPLPFGDRLHALPIACLWLPPEVTARRPSS